MGVVNMIPPVHEGLIIVCPLCAVAERSLGALDTRRAIRKPSPRLVVSDEVNRPYGRPKAFVRRRIAVCMIISVVREYIEL